MTEIRGRQMLLAFVRGQENWRALTSLGVAITFEDGLRMTVPADCPVVRPSAADVALGLVALLDSPDLRQWAAVVLGLGNIDLDDVNQHVHGPALLDALWDASCGHPIDVSALLAARALVKGPRLQ